jgi:hypothetical protein
VPSVEMGESVCLLSHISHSRNATMIHNLKEKLKPIDVCALRILEARLTLSRQYCVPAAERRSRADQ